MTGNSESWSIVLATFGILTGYVHGKPTYDSSYLGKFNLESLWAPQKKAATITTDSQRAAVIGDCDLVPLTDNPNQSLTGRIQFSQKHDRHGIASYDMSVAIDGIMPPAFATSKPTYELTVHASRGSKRGCAADGWQHADDRYSRLDQFRLSTDTHGRIRMDIPNVSAVLVDGQSIFGRTIMIKNLFQNKEIACCAVHLGRPSQNVYSRIQTSQTSATHIVEQLRNKPPNKNSTQSTIITFQSTPTVPVTSKSAVGNIPQSSRKTNRKYEPYGIFGDKLMLQNIIQEVPIRESFLVQQVIRRSKYTPFKNKIFDMITRNNERNKYNAFKTTSIVDIITNANDDGAYENIFNKLGSINYGTKSGVTSAVSKEEDNDDKINDAYKVKGKIRKKFAKDDNEMNDNDDNRRSNVIGNIHSINDISIVDRSDKQRYDDNPNINTVSTFIADAGHKQKFNSDNNDDRSFSFDRDSNRHRGTFSRRRKDDNEHMNTISSGVIDTLVLEEDEDDSHTIKTEQIYKNNRDEPSIVMKNIAKSDRGILADTKVFEHYDEYMNDISTDFGKPLDDPTEDWRFVKKKFTKGNKENMDDEFDFEDTGKRDHNKNSKSSDTVKRIMSRWNSDRTDDRNNVLNEDDEHANNFGNKLDTGDDKFHHADDHAENTRDNTRETRKRLFNSIESHVNDITKEIRDWPIYTHDITTKTDEFDFEDIGKRDHNKNSKSSDTVKRVMSRWNSDRTDDRNNNVDDVPNRLTASIGAVRDYMDSTVRLVKKKPNTSSHKEEDRNDSIDQFE